MASKAQCLAINIEIGLARNQMVQKQHVGVAVAMVVVWAAVVVQEATAMLAAIVSVVTKHDLASDATNLRLRILIEIPISTGRDADQWLGHRNRLSTWWIQCRLRCKR